MHAGFQLLLYIFSKINYTCTCTNRKYGHTIITNLDLPCDLIIIKNNSKYTMYTIKDIYHSIIYTIYNINIHSMSYLFKVKNKIIILLQI